jgi:hypothetical protein
MRGIGAVLVLVACGDGKGGDGEPRSGSWTYASTGTGTDSCGIVPLLGLDGGTFDLVNEGDGTLTIDDGTWVFECTLTGGDFDCPDRFPGGFDRAGVQMEVAGEAHGTFDADDEGSGAQSGTASCADSDCEAAAATLGMSPPCEVDVSFTITLDR